jgi:hypothetical protein
MVKDWIKWVYCLCLYTVVKHCLACIFELSNILISVKGEVIILKHSKGTESFLRNWRLLCWPRKFLIRVEPIVHYCAHKNLPLDTAWARLSRSTPQHIALEIIEIFHKLPMWLHTQLQLLCDSDLVEDGRIALKWFLKIGYLWTEFMIQDRVHWWACEHCNKPLGS